MPFFGARSGRFAHQRPERMARTYGEILECSFADVFGLASGPDTVFVDIGSGHGAITFEAVRTFGCCFALGIEKYREPAEVCTEHLLRLPPAIRDKVRFILEDINDVDLANELRGRQYARLLLFCNNLAFSPGTVKRLARKVEALMERALCEKEVILVSTVPLDGLKPHFQKHLLLRMSWTEELHETCMSMGGLAAMPGYKSRLCCVIDEFKPVEGMAA